MVDHVEMHKLYGHGLHDQKCGLSTEDDTQCNPSVIHVNAIDLQIQGRKSSD